MTLPHQFEKLRRDQRPTALFCGAGLSAGLVKLPRQLANDCAKATVKLGCSYTTALTQGNESTYLYPWAQAMEDQLINQNVPVPKLKIAEALGILTDLTWLGEEIDELPARGNSARHRVIARLACEERWNRIWTVNWDCLLETALESIGCAHHDLWNKKHDAPWITKYHSYVVTDGLGKLGAKDCIQLIKPNGCARAMHKAKSALETGNTPEATKYAERFLITQRELDMQDPSIPSNKSIFVELESDIQKYPFVAIGWSIGEKYIQELFKKMRNGNPENGKPEEFTVIDPWYGDDHKIVGAFYALKETDAHVCVEPKINAAASITVDQLFLLIQALYAFNCMDAHGITVDAKLYAAVCVFPQNEKFLAWADDFLPSWTRLCARAKLVPWKKGGFPVPEEAIRMDLQDYHIPWQDKWSVDRPDLKSAFRLIEQLHKSKGEWNLREIPGALLNTKSRHLVLPVPIGATNDLRSMKPLLNDIESKKGYWVKLFILPLQHDTAPIPDNFTQQVERMLLASSRSSMALTELNIIPLEDL